MEASINHSMRAQSWDKLAAAYRNFVDRDDLMATVATEGFHEFASMLREAANRPDADIAIGLAYVEFASVRQGLFRLMFGPLLALKERYPALRKAAADAFGVIERSGFGVNEGRHGLATKITLGAIHGVSWMLVDNVLSEQDARLMAREILENARLVRA